MQDVSEDPVVAGKQMEDPQLQLSGPRESLQEDGSAQMPALDERRSERELEKVIEVLTAENPEEQDSMGDPLSHAEALAHPR